MRNNKTIAEAQGRRAEWLASLFLRLKGYHILARRVKTPRGEVDLVARRGRLLIFVEVKHRSRAEMLAEAIRPKQLSRIALAAEILAPRFAKSGDAMRIDAILVAPGRWPRHLTDIWRG